MLFGERVSPGLRGTQTRPPSPRALSEIKRHLSSPGMAVGCTCIISGLPYFAPACQQRDAAPPVQMTLIVDLPKISPLPPVAITTASPRNARISIVRMS